MEQVYLLLKDLDIRNIVGYIGKFEKGELYSFLEEMTKGGMENAMLIFPDEKGAYRALDALGKFDSAYIPDSTSIEIRIQKREGVLAAGHIEDLSALEFFPDKTQREKGNNPPLFIVMNYGNA